MGNLLPAIDLRRDAGGDAPVSKSFAKPVGIIAPVRQHRRGWRQGIDEDRCAFVIAGLSFGECQADGTPATIANGMELDGQSATAASDTSG